MKKIAFISAGIAVAAGLLSMFISWHHNSQCEIHCDGAVDWAYWFTIGLSWAVAVFLITLVGAAIGRKVFTRLDD